MLKMELTKFNLISLSFQINPSFKHEKPVDVVLNFSMGSNYKKTKKEIETFLGAVYKEKEAPFNFTIQGRGIFKLNEEPSEEDLERLSSINCPAIIFPFLREIIADITRRAGFPPLYLPITNFVDLSKTIKKNQKEKKVKT